MSSIEKTRTSGGRSTVAVVGTLIGKTVIYILLTLVAISALFPVVWMLYSSFKSSAEIFGDIFAPPTSLYLGNYEETFEEVGRWVLNSLLVDGVSVLLLLVISSLAAYAFSQLKFRGKEALYLFMLIGLMIPTQAMVIAGYQWLTQLQIGGQLALILVYTSWSTFGILVIRGAFDAIPKSMIESARMDGASEWQILFRVLLPLSRGSLATVAIYMFIWLWNDFVFPLVLLQNPEEATIPVGILSYQSRTGVQWGEQMAALALATIVPLVIYLIARRQFVKGVMEGAIKG